MIVAYNDNDVDSFLSSDVFLSRDHPVVISKFIQEAKVLISYFGFSPKYGLIFYEFECIFPAFGGKAKLSYLLYDNKVKPTFFNNVLQILQF